MLILISFTFISNDLGNQGFQKTGKKIVSISLDTRDRDFYRHMTSCSFDLSLTGMGETQNMECPTADKKRYSKEMCTCFD